MRIICMRLKKNIYFCIGKYVLPYAGKSIYFLKRTKNNINPIIIIMSAFSFF